MSKLKRPEKIQTSLNGVNGTSSTTSSPSLSAKNPPSAQFPPSSATNNGNGINGTVSRTANRPRRDGPTQLLGRGQRTTSTGLRSASIVADATALQVSEPRPYVQSDAYILKTFRGCPPSLVVHLHPNHFRFDQQDSTFTYKSPMKIFIEHLRTGTVPHDLMEHFNRWNINFYDGCLIVEVHDHKSIATTRDTSQVTNAAEKTEPFSIHKWNDHLTPSSWVPFPKKDPLAAIKFGGSEIDVKQKSALEKDKENMPAPNQPLDSQRNKPAKKPKISTIVLHPTDLAGYTELAIKALTPVAVSANTRRESRVDIRAATPMSASGLRPQTPMIAIPPTPHIGMEPPAKRFKRERMELEGKAIHEFEAEVLLRVTAPLFLDTVDNPEEAAKLLEALEHPEHASKVPSPKARKKTVAEMAAEESAAANDEQYMLILDERLSSNSGAAGAANPGDGDGQTGSASWEPRFERFKAIESIKLQSVENKKKEKMLQAEQAKRQQQEGEAREKLRLENLKRQQEEEQHQRLQQLQQQQHQQHQQHQQQLRQQDHARRQMVQQAQQNQPGLQGQHGQLPQAGPQHAHPPQNVMTNGMSAGQQRLIQQQQQFSQAQASSPIVRNATPHNLSSPMVATNLGVQMQHSNSGMGGSPPRPGSVVQQGHPQMTQAMAQAMRTQGSQNSHGGTPRLPNATPNMPQTIPRQMNQTPRISQSSPNPGQMAQTPLMNNSQMMMQNNQMANMQLQQAQQIAQQQAQHRMRQHAVQQAMGSSPVNAQQMTPQFALQQMQQQQGNTGIISSGQMSQQYANQMRQMAQVQQAALQQGGNPNFMGANVMHPQLAQAQQMQQQHGQQQLTPMQRHIQILSQKFYTQGLQNLSMQYGGQVPPEIMMQYKQSCSARAQMQVSQQIRAQQMRAQQQAGMTPNMNMNGMGMQRPPGM